MPSSSVSRLLGLVIISLEAQAKESGLHYLTASAMDSAATPLASRAPSSWVAFPRNEFGTSTASDYDPGDQPDDQDISKLGLQVQPPAKSHGQQTVPDHGMEFQPSQDYGIPANTSNVPEHAPDKAPQGTVNSETHGQICKYVISNSSVCKVLLVDIDYVRHRQQPSIWNRSDGSVVYIADGGGLVPGDAWEKMQGEQCSVVVTDMDLAVDQVCERRVYVDNSLGPGDVVFGDRVANFGRQVCQRSAARLLELQRKLEKNPCELMQMLDTASTAQSPAPFASNELTSQVQLEDDEDTEYFNEIRRWFGDGVDIRFYTAQEWGRGYWRMLGATLAGVWDDTGLVEIDDWPHQFLCLEEQLPDGVSIAHVSDSEQAAVLEHGFGRTGILGQFGKLVAIDPSSLPVTLFRSPAAYCRAALAILATLSAVYGVSNYRQVQSLWQLQRHALVFHYHFDTRPSGKALSQTSLARLLRAAGLVKTPPIVKDIPVDPVVVPDMKVPGFTYLGNFWALRAYTSPRQLQLEMVLFLAEVGVLWGGLALLSVATGGVVENPLGPLQQTRQKMFDNNDLVGEVVYRYDSADPGSSTGVTFLAVIATTLAAIASLVVYACSRSKQVRNFMYLWTQNVAGLAELALVYHMQPFPSRGSFVPEFVGRENPVAVSGLFTVSYALYAIFISVPCFNLSVTRVLEDAVLAAFMGLQFYLITHATFRLGFDKFRVRQGEEDEPFRACDSMFDLPSNGHPFLDYHYSELISMCSELVVTCTSHDPEQFKLVLYPEADWGQLIAQIVVVAFRAFTLWFENRMNMV